MVAVATMTRAVKAVSTYRGRDPRDFALCAFGGNGPVVGVEIARALSMRHVLVPPAPGVFSAVGLLFSGTEQEFVRTLLLRSGEIDPDAITEAYRCAGRGGLASLADEGIAPETATFRGSPTCATRARRTSSPSASPEGRVDVAAADRRRSPPSTSAPTATARRRPGRPRLDPDARAGRARRARATVSPSGAPAAAGAAYAGSAYFGPRGRARSTFR